MAHFLHSLRYIHSGHKRLSHSVGVHGLPGPLVASCAKVILNLLLPAKEVSTKMVLLLAADEAPWRPASSSPLVPVWFAVLVALGLFVAVRSTAAFLAWLHRLHHAFLRRGCDLARRWSSRAGASTWSSWGGAPGSWRAHVNSYKVICLLI